MCPFFAAAMAMTEEQMMQWIARAVSAAMVAARAGEATATPTDNNGGERGGGGSNTRVLREKGFSEVPKLSGQDQYADWSYDFRIAMATMSPQMRKLLEGIQELPQDMDLESTYAADPAKAEKMNLPLRAAELFQILVLKTDGEAKLLVKSVPQEDGLRAWQVLYRHYHRKTFAKAIRDHREVLYPKALKELAEVVRGIMEWEEKLCRLEKSYGVIPELLKIAALVEMLPQTIKDMVMMQPDEHQDYAKLKQKIFTWTANKIPANTGPVPMDIGSAEAKGGDNDEEEYDYDVNAINGACYRCGGWGHAARDCATPATPKGKGKGDGKGKGMGKGGKGEKGKGKGKGKGFGKGYGYQGECWKCGRVGHKAAECRQVGAVDEEEYGEEDEEVTVNTVWNVGHVEVTPDPPNATDPWEDPPVPEKSCGCPCAPCAPMRVSRKRSCPTFCGAFSGIVDADAADDVDLKDGSLEHVEATREPGGDCMLWEPAMRLSGAKCTPIFSDDVSVDVNAAATVDVEDWEIKKPKTKPIKVTLDSGAGASCWPEKLLRSLPMESKTKGVRFSAANGTELKYYGRRT